VCFKLQTSDFVLIFWPKFVASGPFTYWSEPWYPCSDLSWRNELSFTSHSFESSCCFISFPTGLTSSWSEGLYYCVPSYVQSASLSRELHRAAASQEEISSLKDQLANHASQVCTTGFHFNYKFNCRQWSFNLQKLETAD
jgi:hypothetical protein